MEEENNNNANKVVEEGKKLAKEAIKEGTKGIRQKIITWALPVIGWAALILIAVGCLNLIVYEIRSFFRGKVTTFGADELSSTAGVQMQDLISFGPNGEYKLNEDYANDLIEELESKSIDTKKLGLITPNGTNMIDKYIKIELQMLLPKTKTNGDFDGLVKIERIKPDGTKIDLKYEKYETFKSNPTENCFTINPDNFKILVLGGSRTTTYKDINGNAVTGPTDGDMAAKIEEINYQQQIQSCAVPFDFLLTLHSFSQNVNFMNAVINKILENKEPIVLSYVESSVTETTKKSYSGNEYIYEKLITTYSTGKKTYGQEVQIKQNEINNQNIQEYKNSYNHSSLDLAWTEKIVTTITSSLHVTKADTWLKTSGKKVETQSTPDTQTGETISKDFSGKYSEIVETKENVPKGGKTEIENIHKMYVREESVTTLSTNKNTLVAQENKIKVNDFVDLIKRYPKVKDNLESAPSNIFSLLEEQENTQMMAKVMRYVLFKLSGIYYGVSEEDLEDILFKDLRPINTFSNLSTYLRQFSHSDEAPKTSDGKFYIMYGDGVGWPTIGNADLQWASHHNKFNFTGKVLDNGVEKEVNIQQYVNSKLPRGPSAEYSDAEVSSYGIYIEVLAVDKVGDEMQKYVYNAVVQYTSGLDLSRQQLFALTAIRYNFGHLPSSQFSGKSFKQVYQEATALYEINSWQHNRYIWDNWWAHLGGGAAGHIPARDAAFETYVKGVYNFSNSDAGKVFQRAYYIYYTAAQVAKFSYAPNIPITRTAANEEEIFTYVERSGGISGTIVIGGYEYQLYTSSNGKTYTWYYQGYGPWSGYTSSGGSTMAAAGCFCTTSSIIASGYGNTDTPHWGRNIYELIFETPDGNCPQEQSCSDSGSYGQDLTDYEISKIQEWLFSGGEIIIHVGSGSKYTGWQHWMPIVDISDDGQEVYIMNTVKSYEGWNNISDLAKDVDCYYRIKGLR